jgi:hypothetical protein
MSKFRASLIWSAQFVAALLPFCTTSRLNAETFTITLTPSEQTSEFGMYLAAPFDFGTAFSEIQSVSLEFVLPSGYQGTAVTTGNSSAFSSLEMLLYDAAIPVPDYWYNSTSSLGASAFNVRAATPAEFRFAYSVSLGGDDSPPDWPDFLFTGIGQVGWADTIHASRHLIGSGMESSSTSWLLPGEIQSARLTVVGTPIPEPASNLLLLIGALAVPFCSHVWRRRRQAAAAARSL